MQVAITFTDTEGRNVKIEVTDRCSNDFNKNKSEKFDLDLNNLGKIHAIYVERDNSSEDDEWYVVFIVFNDDSKSFI